MNTQKKVMVVFTSVFLVILLTAALGLVQQGRSDDAKNVVVKIILWIVYSCFEWKCGIQLSNGIRASIMAVLISDSMFGIYWGFYNTSSVFDKIQHIFGTYAFSLFAYSVICKLSNPIIGKGFTFIFVLALGLSMGALYEIGEFLGDAIAKPRIPSQPNLLDTDLDLIADIIGSLFAAVHVTIILVGNFKSRNCL